MEENNIKVSRDHIWFYEQINDKSALSFNQQITDIAHERCKHLYDGMFNVIKPTPIWVHINSGGGTLTSAMSMVDTINRIKRAVPVITIVEGVAASAATLVSLVGTTRVIRENSYMLIHQLSNIIWGNFEELKDGFTNSDNFMKDIKKFYKKYSKIPVSSIDELLKHDLFFNAKTCKKYGLVDDIIV